MRFYADSVFAHIQKEIERHFAGGREGGRLLLMLPAVPPWTALRVAQRLADFADERDDLGVPVIRFAGELCREWEGDSSPDVKQILAEIEAQGWRDDDRSLTQDRSKGISTSEGVVPVLLIGVDRVTDAASLADFHSCGMSTIWETELRKGFSAWTRTALNEAGVAFENDVLGHFDEVLVPLIERGLADAFQVSALLEGLDLTAAQDGRDAEACLLGSLDRFGLPAFRRYRFGGRQRFQTYLTDAVDFFTYDAFLEDRSRKKATTTIDKFKENHEIEELFDTEDRKAYDSDQSFVDGLRTYVETRDAQERAKLLECDFVTIHDKILGYRPPKGDPKERTTVKKLSGGPVEVVLTGLWATMGEFKRQITSEGFLAHEALKEIRITSYLFKHDQDGDSADDRLQAARHYWARLAGGIDTLLEEWLDPARICGEGSELKVISKLVRGDLDCQPSRTGEPYLEFHVELTGEGLSKPVVGRFAWRLPEVDSYRVADELIAWAGERIEKADGYCLPVYQMPHHEELMLAKDDEEVRRVMRQCVQAAMDGLLNILGVAGVSQSDPLLSPLQKLAFAYDGFIQQARTDGIHAALSAKWPDLRKAYEEAADAYLEQAECASSPLAALLFRAFMMVQDRDPAEADRWVWRPYEESAVITVLHPALLEMLQGHLQFILTCFNTLAGRELRSPGSRSFREATWRNYLDLAAIQMPLSGILKDRNLLLDTDTRGDGLIHRIGTTSDAEASLTTRLLLRYDDFEEEDVSDSELFRPTRESLLIYRVLRDYRKLHPHANDGLSIAVYTNEDIQPTIAAIDQLLADVFTERSGGGYQYALCVTVFTESADDTSIARWINQWKERWEAAENQGALAHYRHTRLSVAHRIVARENYYKQFRQIIVDGLAVDIAFLCNFIGAGSEGNDFEEVGPYDVTTRTLKFPILEKSFCALPDPEHEMQRARVLSNRQFRITTRHAEIMARLSRRRAPQSTHHVVLGYGDYTPWQGVVDDLHKRSGWVVCIDPNVDEKLVKQKADTSEAAREIIGFGSGVGAHGEDNYTISTEQFHLGDVLQRLKASVQDVYSGWDAETLAGVAGAVLAEAQRLSGLSLVRATGIGHYIRDFMAYALTRKLLQAGETPLCNHLVSLDAYQHWFDGAESDMRPDLVWVTAQVREDQRLHLDLRLIECKLARHADCHLEKARQQLINGLRHLVNVFMPRNDDAAGEDDRPDQRYWWLQLHRLIASTAAIGGTEQKTVLTALERLADGDFSVEWHAGAVTYWTDESDLDLSLAETWTEHICGCEIGIGVASCGTSFVRRLCLEDAVGVLPWDDRSIQFDAVIERAPARGDTGDGGEEPPDEGDIRSFDDLPGGGSCSSGGHLPASVSEKAGTEKNEHTKDVEVPPRVPDRILLGQATSGSRDVYWEFGHPELSNRHLLIFGTSGMGKTYTIQCLLCELGKATQGSLIVDYTNGFTKNQLEPELQSLLNPTQHYVQRQPLAINPFRQQIQEIDGDAFVENSSSTAQRVAGVFSEVYSFGDQQKAALYQAIKSGIENSGDWDLTLQEIIPLLESIAASGGTAGNSAASVISKIRPFIDQNPFGTEELESWEKLFNDARSRCHILQLAGFARDASRLITEFSLIDLYWFYRSHGSPARPRVVVLDEVQNLDHREESPLSQLLREGRKFGFSLILATQIMSNLNRDERDRLFNAAHKLFFKPADTEMRTYADIAAMLNGDRPEEWLKRLASLKKGECYSLGPSLNEATGSLDTKVFRIRISPLSKRISDG